MIARYAGCIEWVGISLFVKSRDGCRCSRLLAILIITTARSCRILKGAETGAGGGFVRIGITIKESPVVAFLALRNLFMPTISRKFQECLKKPPLLIRTRKG